MYGVKFNLRSLSTGIPKEVYYCGMDGNIVTHSDDKNNIQQFPTLSTARLAMNYLRKRLGYDYGYYIGRVQLL